MSFSKKIKYFLVHQLKISYDEAQRLIESGEVQIDGVVARTNCFLEKNAEIKVNGNLVQERIKFTYYLLYKPRGIECTHNPEIPDNILKFMPNGLHLFSAGRLDKESEGLLFLTNDGDAAWQIMHTGIEKEYIVEVEETIDEAFCEKMRKGVEILGQMTKPCKVFQVGEKSFRIILTQGMNRQIRRMCYKCGREVQFLKRIRIGNYLLGELNSGEGKFVELLD